MKSLSLFLLLCSNLSTYLFAQNPIITNIYTADPTARVYNGKLYIYPSHDVPWNPAWEKLGAVKETHGHVMTDYHAFSTTDLINYTDHSLIKKAPIIIISQIPLLTKVAFARLDLPQQQSLKGLLR